MTYSRDATAISEFTGQPVRWEMAPLPAGITLIVWIALISSTTRVPRQGTALIQAPTIWPRLERVVRSCAPAPMSAAALKEHPNPISSFRARIYFERC
ncbi:hypothetical protein [Microvirga tunisiensis]|jgi:hypothetical protein|uniref:Uncharacterized protein n=1 Tax=Microvirga tunisiensis TaxID=2108360 RepID=A0A5N7MTD2_9HYPH|nr:hypothetical protein [Microvirga tunisiensis]MPR12255.1 hypothetical protein [Microvirga tunisiensis]MPR30223.1 hypothetical protein [Microvirga tunisiensis]